MTISKVNLKPLVIQFAVGKYAILTNYNSYIYAHEWEHDLLKLLLDLEVIK